SLLPEHRDPRGRCAHQRGRRSPRRRSADVRLGLSPRGEPLPEVGRHRGRLGDGRRPEAEAVLGQRGPLLRALGPAGRGTLAMPTFSPSSELQMHYLVDDFTDPWTEPETILLLHGNAESSLSWYGWVPLLARRFRVVRPDMRGYGASTPMPRDFKWSLDVI